MRVGHDQGVEGQGVGHHGWYDLDPGQFVI